MNANDVLKYGHQTVLNTLDSLSKAAWTTGGACGVWSVKDIIAHLASFEWVLVDVLGSCVEAGPTPHLDTYLNSGAAFNDTEVERRKHQTPDEALAEYIRAHTEVMTAVRRISEETLREPGTIAWYGDEYALDDYIVYQFYGHKREHMAQVDLFRDTYASA